MSRTHLAHFCRFFLLTAAVGGSIARGENSQAASAGRIAMYVGTYTQGDSKGIYRCELELPSGKLSEPRLVAEVANPSFLAVHPNRQFLYAVCELEEFDDSKGGAVSAFSIDPKSGDLTLLNSQSSRGAGPCHLVVDRQAKNVLVANYNGGSVAVLPLEEGALRAASEFVQHEGSSINPRRQEGPHAHSINLDAANRLAFVADLGLDKVLVYKFDAAAGKLAPHDPPAATLPPGSGPRHFAFHPGGRWAYVINELASTVTALAYDAAKGTLDPLQTISTLPDGEATKNTTAEVQVHPSGKFLYGSNRGHDSIAMFAIDANTGKLAPLGHQPTGGRTPRNFAIDPTGAFLLAANQDSGTVTVHRIDPATGRLERIESMASIPSPVCLKFISPPSAPGKNSD